MKKESGFSIIELLITCAIISIFISIIYSTFSNTSTSIEKAKPRVDMYQQSRVIFNRMEKEISSAFFSQSNINIRFKSEGGSNNEYDNDRLDFVCTLNPIKKETRESDLMEISYYLKFGESAGTGALIRRNSGLIDDKIDDGGYEGILGEYLAGLGFRFFDGKDWRDTWDTNKETKLPELVEITLTFHDYINKNYYSASTVISIPMSKMGTI